MAGVVDEDEGLFLTAVPIVNDGVLQVSEGLLKSFEVGIFDLDDIHAACSQSNYSFLHVPGVIFDLVDVLEACISLHVIAQLVVPPVLDNDPLVMVGSVMIVYHLGMSVCLSV